MGQSIGTAYRTTAATIELWLLKLDAALDKLEERDLKKLIQKVAEGIYYKICNLFISLLIIQLPYFIKLFMALIFLILLNTPHTHTRVCHFISAR